MPVAAFALFVLIAQAAPPPSAADAVGEAYYFFLRGQTLERRGDINGAIDALKRASQAAPKVAEIRAELAGVYAREGRAVDAVREAEAALDLEPANREAHRILGFVQAALAERQPAPGAMMAQAISHLEKALVGGHRDPGVELSLGRLYVRTEQPLPAIRTLRAFLQQQPGHREAWLLLAEAFDANGEPLEAIGVLEDVVRESPGENRPLMWLGELYEETGQFDKASAVWRTIAGRSPGDTQYRARSAAADMAGGRLDQARSTLIALTTEAPADAYGWYLLSQVERRSNRLDEAEAAARKILALDAADARGLLALAETQGARGDHAAVIRTLESRLAAPQPADRENGVLGRLAVTLAFAHESAGQPARAIAVLESARAATPDDHDLLFDVAAAYERARRFDEAETAFRLLIAADGAHAPALNYLGYMLADRGVKLDEALGFVRRAVTLDPDNPSYLDSLGWALFKLGRVEEARDPLARAASARPGSSVIQDHAGDVYFSLKQYRAAADAFEKALSGDRDGIDAAVVQRKRDKARALAGG